LTCGERSIRFRPPLNLTAAEADTALEILRKSLKEL
jgi:4-aminobutyrate aminotransferase-like enzyme